MRRENLKLMVEHIERFNPAILKLKELISAGELGEIISISCRRVVDCGTPHKIRKLTITATEEEWHTPIIWSRALSLLYGNRI